MSQYHLTDKDAVGASRWVAESPNGIRFQFIQRIPDQVRSFYIGREFSSAAANQYATACIFQTILNNDSKDKTIKINLSDWQIILKDKKSPLPLESDWQKQWDKMAVAKSAKIAFRWSQFPTVQEHQPGDWFQGMIATRLPPGTKFNLYIKWYENERPHTAIIKNIQCATDRALH